MRRIRNIKWKKPIELSTTQIIAIGFFAAVIIGGLLLSLPVSSADGQAAPFLDALFMSATSVCVTGLVLVDTFSYWSLFGKLVILLLIQVGGLGIVSFTTSIMLIIGRRVTLKDRLLLQDAFNLNTLSGLVRFLRKILKGTFLVEGIGAVCYSFVFIPQFGWIKGTGISIFTAVSAFCNAGIDIIGPSSLTPYVADPWINIVTASLIILGGLGFIVWWNVIDVLKLIRSREIRIRNFLQKLNLHSKITLLTTAILILGGMLLVLLLEYHNDATLGPYSFGSKLLIAFFQSVTLRTAGFATIPQQNFLDSTAFVFILFMFIGGSPVGTAGGIKTTTFALVCIATLSTVKGNEDAIAFKRIIPLKLIRKALSVAFISMLALFSAIIILSVTNDGNFMDIAYETTSAIATVGLSRAYTSSLNAIGKAVIILCMYLGRIGPISLAIAFSFKKGQKHLIYPTENITVG